VKSDNWTICLEGIGPTHEGCACDADTHMLSVLEALEKAGHRILQARYTTGRGEENWRDPVTREMHVDMIARTKAASSSPPTTQVAASVTSQGTSTDAAGKQSSSPMGLRKQGQVEQDWRSGTGLYSGDS
jgi:hypothetical protein